jgi:hypothetical protein
MSTTLFDDSKIADVGSLTDDEKKTASPKPYYVPYDKGNKDGNRWYLETPFSVAWTQKSRGSSIAFPFCFPF